MCDFFHGSSVYYVELYVNEHDIHYNSSPTMLNESFILLCDMNIECHAIEYIFNIFYILSFKCRDCKHTYVYFILS